MSVARSFSTTPPCQGNVAATVAPEGQRVPAPRGKRQAVHHGAGAYTRSHSSST
jgi:hypothetical protein